MKGTPRKADKVVNIDSMVTLVQPFFCPQQGDKSVQACKRTKEKQIILDAYGYTIYAFPLWLAAFTTPARTQHFHTCI